MIFRWYEEKNAKEKMRPYLGASIIGHHCKRYLWLSFRWAKKPEFDGQLLRLFGTGHREEGRIVEELRGIGAQVWEVDPMTKQQFAIVDCDGHFRGHLDGKASDLPEAPHTVHVLEFKTFNSKSFNELKQKRVKVAKPMHYDQMQVYMLKTGLDRAMYIAVNKDNDDIYTERVELDGHHANALIEKAAAIIEMAEPPMRISEDPSWWQCKTCNMHSICHGTEAPLPNCRSCAHSSPAEEAEWVCEKYNCLIPLDNQEHGCDSHRYIPILLEKFAAMTDVRGNDVIYKNNATGAEITNGDTGFLSREIYACKEKRILGDAGLAEMRSKLSALFGSTEVVG
jgi:CRISPR/Cas system-associated exonuclease Cas4 (RecB family)